MDFNEKRNLMLKEAYFGKDLYNLCKVEDADRVKIYRYLIISQYSSDKHCEMTYDVCLKYQALIEFFWGFRYG